MLAIVTSRSSRYLAVLTLTLFPLAGCGDEGRGQTSPPECGYPCDHSAAVARNGAFALTGTLTIMGPFSTRAYAITIGSPCSGIRNEGVNYEDIGSGSPLTVLDNTGAIVGRGELEGGEVTTLDPVNRECMFKISINSIVAGKQFYSLAIGRHPTAQLTEAELRAGPNFILSGSGAATAELARAR